MVGSSGGMGGVGRRGPPAWLLGPPRPVVTMTHGGLSSLGKGGLKGATKSPPLHRQDAFVPRGEVVGWGSGGCGRCCLVFAAADRAPVWEPLWVSVEGRAWGAEPGGRPDPPPGASAGGGSGEAARSPPGVGVRGAVGGPCSSKRAFTREEPGRLRPGGEGRRDWTSPSHTPVPHPARTGGSHSHGEAIKPNTGPSNPPQTR